MESITQKIPHVAYGTMLVRLLSQLTEMKKYSAGETIFTQGQPASAMLFILSGQTELSLRDSTSGETRVIASRGPGEMIGELALTKNTVRSSTLVAKADTTLLEITKESFEKVVKLQPGFATRVLGSLGSKFEEIGIDQIGDLH